MTVGFKQNVIAKQGLEIIKNIISNSQISKHGSKDKCNNIIQHNPMRHPPIICAQILEFNNLLTEISFAAIIDFYDNERRAFNRPELTPITGKDIIRILKCILSDTTKLTYATVKPTADSAVGYTRSRLSRLARSMNPFKQNGGRKSRKSRKRKMQKH